MLNPQAAFPYPGSYALYTDPDVAPAAERTELVRIMYRRWVSAGHERVVVAFPLREGASGTKEVPAAELIDGTPLTPEEEREFHNLDLALRDRSLRTPKQKALAKRRDALKGRMIWSRFLARQLEQLRRHTMRKAA